MKLTPDGNVPLKTKPADPAKSNTQGQKAVQVKKKPLIRYYYDFNLYQNLTHGEQPFRNQLFQKK